MGFGLPYIIVHFAGALITAGLIAELYSLWLVWKKKRTKAQLPLTLGVIYQAMGIMIHLHFGMRIGGIWIIGEAMELTLDAFPYSLVYGVFIGIATVVLVSKQKV